MDLGDIRKTSLTDVPGVPCVSVAQLDANIMSEMIAAMENFGSSSLSDIPGILLP